VPWTHCENQFLLDDEPCPTCGLAKEDWTIQPDRTRDFVISRKARPSRVRLQVRLVDSAGAPLAGEPYRITLADGRVVEGVTSADGQVDLEDVAPGLARIEVTDTVLTAEAGGRDQPQELRVGSGVGPADAGSPTAGATAEAAPGAASFAAGAPSSEAGSSAAAQALEAGSSAAGAQAMVASEAGSSAAGAQAMTGLGTGAPGAGTGSPGAGDQAEATSSGTTARSTSEEVGGASRPGLRFEALLRDSVGRALPYASYRATFSDGRLVEGTSDVRGRLVVEGVPPGPCSVLLPHCPRSGGGHGVTLKAKVATLGPVTLSVSTKLAPTGFCTSLALVLGLKTAGGEPLAGARCQVALPDGRQEEASCDAEGRVVFDPVPPGRCEVCLPDTCRPDDDRPVRFSVEVKVDAKTVVRGIQGLLVEIGNHFSGPTASLPHWVRFQGSRVLGASTPDHYGWDMDRILSEAECGEGLSWTPPSQREVVVLDAGFWGTDPAKVVGSRSFGLLEGNHAHVCELVELAAESPETRESLEEWGCGLALRLQEELKTWGYSFLVRSHESASESLGADGLPGNALTLVIPDVHLPERWPLPKPPPADQRPLTPRERALLRRELYLGLTDPAEEERTTRGMSGERQGDLQRFLWLAEAYLRKQIPSPPAPWEVVDPATEESHAFTAEQVLHERDLLARLLSVESGWLYPPLGPTERDPVEEHVKSKLTEDVEGVLPLTADPAPAIDLAALLGATSSLKRRSEREEPSAVVRAIQVGDLYEVWINREWLYHDFPQGEAESWFQNLKRGGLRYAFWENFQYRFGAGWKVGLQEPRGPGSGTLEALEKLRGKLVAEKQLETVDELSPYVFHRWPDASLEVRRQTGTHRPKDVEQLRAQVDATHATQQLEERLRAVDTHSLPLPGAPSPAQQTTLDRLRHGEAGVQLANYRTEEGLEDEEYRWNRLVLDLLGQLDCVMVRGNHDGYRGDPILTSDLSEDCAGHAALNWASEHGVWAEHGHRWDVYNQDGAPFGPAVTNVVWLNWPMVHARQSESSDIETRLGQFPFFDTLREKIQEGAAQWAWLVAGLSKEGRDRLAEDGGGDAVEPFALLVHGHTHNGNVKRVVFLEALEA
jgi:hypothetical protein